MGNSILILGDSGTGKSTSLRNLDYKETFILNVVDKPLPFRGFKNKYIMKEGGNFAISDNPNKICALIDNVSDHRPDIKNLVIDDFQYILSNEYMRRAKETGYAKFTDIGVAAFNIITKASKLRNDLNLIIIAHSSKDQDGICRLKTVGKVVDDKITFEGRFTVVLHSVVDDGNYKFLTNHNGFLLAKSPMGMFDDSLIDNDMKQILNLMKDYYEYDDENINEDETITNDIKGE
jgi:hypothetical protein